MTTPTQTEYGPEIVVDGVRLPWLKDDDLIIAKWRSNGVETLPDRACLFVSRYWESAITSIRLPAPHPYYTVLNHNAKHGTQFKYWPGGDEAPGDWWDGPCSVLARNGRTFEDPSWWDHRGRGWDIIGYTPRLWADLQEPKWGAPIVCNGKLPDSVDDGEPVYWTPGFKAVRLRADHPLYLEQPTIEEIDSAQRRKIVKEHFAPTNAKMTTVADFVPCERTVQHVAAMLEEWADNGLSSETKRILRAVAKDIVVQTAPKDRARQLLDRWCDDDTAEHATFHGFASWLIAQGEIRG